MERRSDRWRSAPTVGILGLLFCVDGDRQLIGEMCCHGVIGLSSLMLNLQSLEGYGSLALDSGFAIGGVRRKHGSVGSCRGESLLISFPSFQQNRLLDADLVSGSRSNSIKTHRMPPVFPCTITLRLKEPPSNWKQRLVFSTSGRSPVPSDLPVDPSSGESSSPNADPPEGNELNVVRSSRSRETDFEIQEEPSKSTMRNSPRSPGLKYWILKPSRVRRQRQERGWCTGKSYCRHKQEARDPENVRRGDPWVRCWATLVFGTLIRYDG
jgi:hypothetical protein